MHPPAEHVAEVALQRVAPAEAGAAGEGDRLLHGVGGRPVDEQLAGRAAGGDVRVVAVDPGGERVEQFLGADQRGLDLAECRAVARQGGERLGEVGGGALPEEPDQPVLRGAGDAEVDGGQCEEVPGLPAVVGGLLPGGGGAGPGQPYRVVGCDPDAVQHDVVSGAGAQAELVPHRVDLHAGAVAADEEDPDRGTGSPVRAGTAIQESASAPLQSALRPVNCQASPSHRATVAGQAGGRSARFGAERAEQGGSPPGLGEQAAVDGGGPERPGRVPRGAAACGR